MVLALMGSSLDNVRSRGYLSSLFRRPAIVFAIACLLSGVLFSRAATLVVDSGMADQMPFWVEQAIPVVLTDNICGDVGNYTSRSKLHAIFNHGRSPTVTLPLAEVDQRIQAVYQTSPNESCSGHAQSMGNDDKGIVDYVDLAFFLFGPQAASVIYLYGLLMALSIALFLFCFWRQPAYAASLIVLLTGVAGIVPFIAVDTNSASFLALRAFPILTMVACLNLLVVLVAVFKGDFFATDRNRVLGACLLQLMFIVYVAHIRTTTAWQFVVISGVALPVLWVCYKQQVDRGLKFFVLFCSLSLPIHAVAYPMWQHLTYSDIYDNAKEGQLHSRVFYHNIFSGFAFNPTLRDQYQIRVDDWSIMQAASRYMESESRLEEFAGMLPPETDPLAPKGRIGNWSAYDKVVREMVFDTLLKQPGAVLAATYGKLVWFGEYIGWILAVRDRLPSSEVFNPLEWKWDVASEFTKVERAIADKTPRPNPANPFTIFLLAIAAMTLRGRQATRSLWAIPILAAGSLIPVLVGYPSIWGSFDGAVGMLAVLAAIIFVIFALPGFLARRLFR